MSEPRKSIRKLPPCPRYDIERMESWLSDMSAEGWELEQEGFNLIFAHFERTETPRRLEYRIFPVPADEVYPRDSIGDPKQEAVELSRELGWRYISRYDQFYIYAAPQDVACELSTDTQVQAEAMTPFNLYTVFWNLRSLLVLFVILSHRLPTLIDQLSYAPLFTMLPPEGLGLVFWVMATCFVIVRIPYPFLHIIKLRKKLLSGIALDHHADWKARTKRFRIMRRIILSLAVLYLLHTLFLVVGLNQRDLETFDTPVPFVTLQDLCDKPLSHTHRFDDVLLPWGSSKSDNYVEKWISPLAPVNYEWVELGYLYENGEAFPSTSGYLRVTYHQAWTAELANAIAETYGKYDPYNAIDGAIGAHFDLTAPGMDAAYGYYDIGGDPVVVLQKGKVVIMARMRKDPDIGSIQEWVDAMAAKLSE